MDEESTIRAAERDAWTIRDRIQFLDIALREHPESLWHLAGELDEMARRLSGIARQAQRYNMAAE